MQKPPLIGYWTKLLLEDKEEVCVIQNYPPKTGTKEVIETETIYIPSTFNEVKDNMRRRHEILV